MTNTGHDSSAPSVARVDARALIDATSAALVVLDAEGPVEANQAFRSLVDVTLDASRAALRPGRWLAAEEAEQFMARVRDHLQDRTGVDAEPLSLHVTRGAEPWVQATTTTIEVTTGRLVVATLVDITAFKHAAHRSNRARERAANTLASIGDGVIRVDADGRVEYLNVAAERLTGWPLAEALGQPVSQIYQTVPEVNRAAARRDPVAECLRSGRAVVSQGFATLLSRGGHELVVRDMVTPIVEVADPSAGGDARRLSGAVVVLEDLTEVRGLEREMVYLASHDGLTGLLNRAELEIHLEATLESVRTGETTVDDEGERRVSGPNRDQAALLMLDLARFRLINDAAGHQAGDELLRRVGRLLKETADPDAVLARVGSDQFGVLLPTCSPARARRTAQALHNAFRHFRFAWAGRDLDVQVSIGLVMIDAMSESVSHTLQAVETACRVASEAGGERVYEAPRGRAIAGTDGPAYWMHLLHRALAQNTLQLYHQRIVSLRDGTAGFHEMLVRMIDAEGRVIAPGRFVPIAEQYRMAPTLDRWVVREALRLLNDDPVALAGEPITINLSGQSLSDESFLGFVQDQLSTTAVDPRRVLFEITETAAVANLSQASRFLASLREQGFRFVLDDFGSGMSSFGYLKSLPVELLKIDGAFVRTMHTDPLQREMVRSMHEIGQRMGLATIAEWVENEAVLDQLRTIGVDYVQGYHVHRPEALAGGLRLD